MLSPLPAPVIAALRITTSGQVRCGWCTGLLCRRSSLHRRTIRWFRSNLLEFPRSLEIPRFELRPRNLADTALLYRGRTEQSVTGRRRGYWNFVLRTPRNKCRRYECAASDSRLPGYGPRTQRLDEFLSGE